jgi:membrane-associated phospholipid phosphatase
LTTLPRTQRRRYGRARPAPDTNRLAGRVALRLVVAAAVMTGLLIGIGLLLTRTLRGHWPVNAEDRVNRWFAANRTGTRDTLTHYGSWVGETLTIIIGTGVAALVLRLVLHRWRESLFLIAAVAGQAIAFFCTQLVIERQRPHEHRLDHSPPTSSFPSGHTGAALALYGGLAVILLLHARWARLWAVLLFALPVVVAVSRTYRGMHHPTDVTASMVNGGGWLVASGRTFLAKDRP